MRLSNPDIAAKFEAIADLLEIDGANPFRVRAYRNAALTIGDMSRPLTERIADGEDLSKLDDIGKAIAEKIAELVETGRLGFLEELEARLGAGLLELIRIPGLGPKKVRTLHAELGIASVPELENAARAGRLRELAGFGGKTEERILAAIERLRS